MKLPLLLSLSCLFSTAVAAQTFQRQTSESPEAFVERCKPTGEEVTVKGDVLETPYWDSSHLVIIAFYRCSHPLKQHGQTWDDATVDGYVFVPTGNNNYQRVLIDSYGQEGIDADISSVFFANADKDKQRELIVLCTWDQSHHYGISGSIYQAYIYDNIDYKKIPSSLKGLKQFDKIFEMESDGTNDSGESSHAKYTSAAAIRKKLKQLGY